MFLRRFPRPADTLTARESVWTYRIRQRIALERIILKVGKPKEKSRAKRFLEAMQQACPELLDDFEQYDLELHDYPAPELFDPSEYVEARGRKQAFKLPKDIVWEDKVIRRAVRDYAELFHPCDNAFHNAMTGLRYLNTLHPELFTRARARAIEQRGQILTCELYCKCGCTTPENRRPAASFKMAQKGRFANVSQRIEHARQAPGSTGDMNDPDWLFFLDRVKEVAPEMLTG